MVQHRPPEPPLSHSYRAAFATRFDTDRVASRQILDHGMQNRIIRGLQTSACGTPRCTMEAQHLCEELSLQRYWAEDFVSRFPEHRGEFAAMQLIQALPMGVQKPHYIQIGPREVSASEQNPSHSPRATQYPSAFPAENKGESHPHPSAIEIPVTSDDNPPLMPRSHCVEPIADLLTFAIVGNETPAPRPATPTVNHGADSFPKKDLGERESQDALHMADTIHVASDLKPDVSPEQPFEPAPNIPLTFLAQLKAGAFGHQSQSRTVIINNLPNNVGIGQVLEHVCGGRVVKAILVSVAGLPGLGDMSAIITFETPQAAQRFMQLAAQRKFGFKTINGNHVEASVVSSGVASHPFKPNVGRLLEMGCTRCLQVDVQVHRSIDPCSANNFDASKTPFTDCRTFPHELGKLMSVDKVPNRLSMGSAVDSSVSNGSRQVDDRQKHEMREIYDLAGMPWPRGSSARTLRRPRAL
ncbi:predicted protein [Verticillium alfalfae VaMs.102]|uniref:Predicted protein n=1 Tax=Verticillium alfalfae (strain VaMs.102 / ATCC MYA-4576 / FGSC 10136) TaxID=526221 RepID=C9SJ33_VERA1|nr:predicted protein [Verticillium alfalfae VaMs.102]EEY18956.1 predicted protein [Verticillium alfalfae VaMs.102]